MAENPVTTNCPSIKLRTDFCGTPPDPVAAVFSQQVLDTDISQQGIVCPSLLGTSFYVYRLPTCTISRSSRKRLRAFSLAGFGIAENFPGSPENCPGPHPVQTRFLPTYYLSGNSVRWKAIGLHWNLAMAVLPPPLHFLHSGKTC